MDELPWPQPQLPNSHVDVVRYVVRLTPHPSEESSGVTEGFVVEWDALGVSLDDAARLVPGVAWNPEAGVFEAHVSRQSYTQFEWGASGYALEFALDLVNNVSSDLVWVGLGFVVGKLRGSKRRTELPDLSDLGIVQEDARRAVSSVFGEDYDGVQVVEATRAGSSSRVVLEGSQGRYEATVGILEETGDPYSHVRRM